MNFLLLLLKSMLIILTLLGLAPIVRAQCANGRCPAPSYRMPAPIVSIDPGYYPAPTPAPAVSILPAYHPAPVPFQAPASPNVTWSDGWFRHQDGHVELWRAGLLVAHARPGAPDWEATVSSIPETVRATLGLVPVGAPTAKPSKECVCKPGTCRCDDCPKDCVAGRPAAEAAVPLQQWQTHGVDQTKLANRECYRINGVEVPKERGIRAIGDPAIPDDSKSQRVVVLGSTGTRQQVLDDWSKSPSLVPFKDKAILQAYSADDWAVKDVGYTQSADPTIYVVDAAGKVLHHQEGYAGPAQLAQALRRADPAYDPKKDPDLTKGKPASPAGDPDPLLFGGAAAIAAVGLAMLARRMK